MGLLNTLQSPSPVRPTITGVDFETKTYFTTSTYYSTVVVDRSRTVTKTRTKIKTNVVTAAKIRPTPTATQVRHKDTTCIVINNPASVTQN